MSIKPIVIWPDPVLQTPAKRVTDFGPALEALLQDMHDSVRAANGIGIAANQIGVGLRLALVGQQEGEAIHFFEIVNPEILERADPVEYEEGCLSVPEEWHVCPRFRRVKVRYQSRDQQWHEVEAEDKLAHVLQHETDHLEGLVYVNHLGTMARDVIRRRMLKLKQGAGEEPEGEEEAEVKPARKAARPAAKKKEKRKKRR